MRALVCKFGNDFLIYFSFFERSTYIFIEFIKLLIGPKKFCHTENKAETNKTYDHDCSEDIFRFIPTRFMV